MSGRRLAISVPSDAVGSQEELVTVEAMSPMSPPLPLAKMPLSDRRRGSDDLAGSFGVGSSSTWSNNGDKAVTAAAGGVDGNREQQLADESSDPAAAAAARCGSIRQTLRRMPNPTNAQTHVAARFVHASIVSEKIQNNISVADERVFQLAERYLLLHTKQHKKLTKQHWKRQEAAIYQIPSFLRRWEQIFEHPLKTTAGRTIVVVEAMLAVWTAVQLMLETLPQYNVDVNPDIQPLWFLLELVNTVLFLILAIARLVVLQRKSDYLKNGMNYIDVLSISPFFIQIAVNNRKYIVLKALRIARLIRPFRGFPHVEAINTTLKKIATSLIAPYTLLATSVVLFGCILYWAEAGTYTPSYFDATKNTTYSNVFLQEDCLCTSTASYSFGNATCPLVPSQFQSIVQAMWFTAVAFTTVGYGDIVPRCIAGKAVTAIGLLFSTIFIAMPIAIVGTSFTETVIQQEQELAHRKHIKAKGIRQSRLQEQMTGAMKGRLDRRNPAGSGALSAADGLFRHLASAIGRQTISLNSLAWVPPQGVENDVQRFHQEGVSAARQVTNNIATGGASRRQEQLLIPMLDASAGSANVVMGSADYLQAVPNLQEHLVGRKATTQLPVAARFHETIVNAADSYVAWLMEYWVCEWLEQQAEAASLQSTGYAASPGRQQPQQGGSIGQAAQREFAFQRQQQSALAAQQRELIPVLAGKHPVVLLSGSQYQPSGFASQVLIRKRACVELAAVPAAAGGGGIEQTFVAPTGTRVTSNSSPVSGSYDRYAAIRGQHKVAITGARRSAGIAHGLALAGADAANANVTSNPTGAAATNCAAAAAAAATVPWANAEFHAVVNLYSEELIQSRAVGRFEILESFAQRLVRFVPYDLHFSMHHVNGIPIEEVAGQQYLIELSTGPHAEAKELRQLLGAPIDVNGKATVDWTSPRNRQLVASIVSDMRANSLLCDLHPLSAYSCSTGQDGMATTLHDRSFAVIVEEDDVITFSPIVKLVDDVVASSMSKGNGIEKLTQNYMSACNLPLDSPLTPEVREMLCKSRAAQLARLGIRPLEYRVSLSGLASQQQQQLQKQSRDAQRSLSTKGGTASAPDELDQASKLLEDILGNEPLTAGDGAVTSGDTTTPTSARQATSGTPRQGLPDDSNKQQQQVNSPAARPITPLRSALKKSSASATPSQKREAARFL